MSISPLLITYIEHLLQQISLVDYTQGRTYFEKYILFNYFEKKQKNLMYYICVCMYVSVCLYMCKFYSPVCCLYTHKHTHTYTQTHTHTYTHIHTHIHTHIRTHTYTHTHTHIHISISPNGLQYQHMYFKTLKYFYQGCQKIITIKRKE